MASTANRSVTSIADLDHVVDCDFHLTESEADFLPYVEPPWDELLAKPLETIERGQFLSPLYPKSGLLNLGRTTGRIPPKSVKTPADVEAGKAELGVDTPILTPGLNLSLGAVHHDELATELASAYNRWLADTLLDEGYKGAAVVAPHRPAAAAEEIDEVAGESGVVAIEIPTGGVNPPLGHERYHPIFEAVEDAGLPVMMHGTANATFRNFPIQYQGLDRHLSLHFMAQPFGQMVHIASMLTKGVPVLFPDIDFVVQETGLGWIPYFMHRLDSEYPTEPEDAPLLEMVPSKYLKRQFYFTSQPIEGTTNPEYVRGIIRMFGGEERLMLSSDYPHYDFDHTSQLLDLLRPEFDDDEIRNIYGETARRVYDL